VKGGGAVNLREKSIDELVEAVQTSIYTASGNNPQSVMAVFGRCTIELSERLKEASKEASRGTTALVRATWALVLVTLVYVFVAGGPMLASFVRYLAR
jgi:hypothetical protein